MSAAPRDRRPPGLDQGFVAVIDHLFTPGGTGSVPSHQSVSPYNKEKNWDGTDVSADLSSEALGEGGSLGEGRGHPSLKNDIHLGGLQSLAAAGANKVPTLEACLVAAKVKLASFSAAPRDRTPPGLDQSSNDRF